MQQRDIIKDEIEQVGKVIGKIIADFLGYSSGDEPVVTIEVTNNLLKEELDIDVEELLLLSEDEMKKYLKERKLTSVSVEKLAEYIAKIGTNEVTHNNSLAKNKLNKSLELFDFAGELSQTMSFERMNKKMKIQKLLDALVYKYIVKDKMLKNSPRLTSAELKRYSRHLAIPEFNITAQEKLKAAKVLVIGSGGLGSPLLLYLTAAGVGHIGIVDFDVVDDSNLQRQVLFTVDDIGKSKAETAKKRLEKLNPFVKFTIYNKAFTKDNALEILADYDVVADGTDNFPTRYLVNDACVLAGKINVYASVLRFEGQVSVFNYPNEDGSRGINYRDLFPEPPPPDMIPNCADGGVLGVLPGIIGSMQASEVIKVITGVGTPLSGRLFLFDAASFTTRVLKLGKKTNTTITKLIDYEQFCGVEKNVNEVPIKEISAQELKEMMGNPLSDFQLIDVREPHEAEVITLGGELIPLATVADNFSKISKNKKVIIYCQSGQRSAKAIRILQKIDNFDNLYNLKGGVMSMCN